MKMITEAEHAEFVAAMQERNQLRALIGMHGAALLEKVNGSKLPPAPTHVSVRGATIQTANGHYFDYERVCADWVDIETVAHSLSNLCRFTGHCREFYSVAQHCFLMSYIVPKSDAFWALMHESGEPWVGDMNKPLKVLLAESFERVETPAERATLIHFGLDPDAKPSTIKPADHVMLATEQRDLMPKWRAVGWDAWGIANLWEPLPAQHWTELQGIVPLERVIRPWVPAQAKTAFLQRYRELAFGAGGVQNGTLIASLAKIQAEAVAA